MRYQTKNTLKIYWQHARKYSLGIAVTILMIFLSTGLLAYVPFLYKKLFDTIALGDPSLAPILFNTIKLILGVSFLRLLFDRLEFFVNGSLQAYVMADLANSCFDYLHQHSYSFFNNNFGGSLVRKVNRFVRAFEEIADQLTWNISQSLLRVLIVIIVLYFRNRFLFAIVLIWSIIYILGNYLFTRSKMKIDIARAEADTKTTGLLADTISNHINLKLFGGRAKELVDFKKLTRKAANLRRLSWNLDDLMGGAQGGAMVLLEFIILSVAIGLWRDGQFSIGDFALIQAYLIQIFDQLWGLGRNIRRVYESLADADEMTEILTTPHEIVDATDGPHLTIGKGQIDFSQLTFSYHQKGTRQIFKNFDLSIKPGERVALIGPSGGGKSTIVKLLFRFFDIQSGEIKIDGQDIAQVTQDSLRNNLALVPQEPILFHRSLMENIRYSKPEASDEEVIKASKLAHCHEFIQSFPQKYNTFVGERGVKLSGGERQRVAIARAILKNAPILVLDEATSSLDSESERYIQDALKNLMVGKTTIVIAHRLSTIMQMDRIIVIDKGKIIEEGLHDELLKLKKGTYRKLWQIQAGGFK